MPGQKRNRLEKEGAQESDNAEASKRRRLNPNQESNPREPMEETEAESDSSKNEKKEHEGGSKRSLTNRVRGRTGHRGDTNGKSREENKENNSGNRNSKSKISVDETSKEEPKNNKRKGNGKNKPAENDDHDNDSDSNGNSKNHGGQSRKERGRIDAQRIVDNNGEEEEEEEEEEYEIPPLPKVKQPPLDKEILTELNQHAKEFLKRSKHLNHSLQALEPFIDTSLQFNHKQANGYNQLLQECNQLGDHFEKTLTQLNKRVVHLAEEKKQYVQNVHTQMATLEQQFQQLAMKASCKDPVLAQENKSLKDKLKEQQQVILSTEEKVKEMKQQLEESQQQNVRKNMEMESQMSEFHEEQARELERVRAQHQIEINHLEMKCRNLETQMNDVKEETKRKEREEATQTAIFIGQLERENDALKEEIQKLKRINPETDACNEEPHGNDKNETESKGLDNNSAVLDTPNSAMNYPCYGDVTSLINAMQRRRSTTSGRSPLSHRSQYVLHAESSLESLRQELTKSKVDIASYQIQLSESKEQTRDFQRQLKDAQLQRQKALEEREMLMQVIGLYEMMTAIKIKCVSDFTTNAMAQRLVHHDTIDKERQPVCFECKALNLQTKSMLTFELSTYMNFMDYKLITAHNFPSLPEFLSSEMSFDDNSGPLFIKELLDVLFGRKAKISPMDYSTSRGSHPPKNSAK